MRITFVFAPLYSLVTERQCWLNLPSTEERFTTTSTSVVLLKVQAQGEGCVEPSAILLDFACDGYTISDPKIVVDNFNAYKSIVLTPAASSKYYSKGSLYNVVGNGTYTVEFTSPNGCKESRLFTAFSQAIVPLAQPLCVYSVVNATFNNYAAIDSYIVGLDGEKTVGQFFSLPAGDVLVSVTSLDRGLCMLRSNLVPKNLGSPVIKVTPASCDASVGGGVVVSNAASYTSITLDSAASASGIFGNLEARDYTLTLVSATCGTQVIHLTVSYDVPTMSIQAVPAVNGCVSSMFDVKVSGDATPTFSVDGGATLLASPLTLAAHVDHKVSYVRGQCTIVGRTFSIPEVTTDITHTFSEVPSCSNPTTTVTLTSSHIDALTVSGSSLSSGQFTATYGQVYIVNDTCTGSLYTINLASAVPSYTFQATKGLTCLDVWDFSVTNAHQFSTLTLIDLVDSSVTYSVGSSGIVTAIPVGRYRLDYVEIGCQSQQYIYLEDYPTGFPQNYDSSLLTISSKVVEMSQCNLGGKLDVTVSYNNQPIQQTIVPYVPNSKVSLPAYRQCSDFSFHLANTYDYISFPVQTPTITNTIVPCTQYDHITAQVQVQLTVDNTSFPIVGVSFNNDFYNVSTSYQVSHSGNVNVNVFRSGCSLPYQVIHSIPPMNDYTLQYTVTPQDSNSCDTANGRIKITRPGVTSLSIVGSDMVAVDNEFVGLASQDYSIQFNAEQDGWECTGTLKINVPTTEVSITTKDLSDTCGIDKVVQLVAKDNSGVIIPVTGSVLTGDAVFVNSSSSLAWFTSYEPVTVLVSSDQCQWKYTYTPSPPSANLFDFVWDKYPSCPGTPDGVVRIVTTTTVNDIVTPYDMFSIGNKIYGVSIPEHNVASPSQSVPIDINWNNDCFQHDILMTLDLANVPVYPMPTYTIQDPTCGSATGKVVFDQATLTSYDIEVRDSYQVIVYPMNADGSVNLLASTTEYWLFSTNRQTGCTRITPLLVWYYDAVTTDNFDIVIHNETCVGSKDGMITMPAATSTAQYHLSIAGQSDEFEGPSSLSYLPATFENGRIYDGLSSENTYIVTMTNPSNPYCFSKMVVNNFGIIQPTIIAPIQDICSSHQLPSIIASLSELSLANVSYSLDGGAAQNTGSFTNLSQEAGNMGVSLGYMESLGDADLVSWKDKYILLLKASGGSDTWGDMLGGTEYADDSDIFLSDQIFLDGLEDEDVERYHRLVNEHEQIIKDEEYFKTKYLGLYGVLADHDYDLLDSYFPYDSKGSNNQEYSLVIGLIMVGSIFVKFEHQH
eukprot:gene15405-18269_t